MRFRGLDLNLIVALDALLAECSVSAAARRLHLSQPAMSAALNRLREHFGDALLVSYGRRMVPTAHASLLVEPVRALLADIDSLVASSAAFEPSRSRRVFKINASDFMTEVLVVPLVRDLAQVAPGVGIEITHQEDDPQIPLERGEIDLLMIPDVYISERHPAELLFADRHVVVGWRDNPAMAGPMTEALFLGLGHVVVEFGRSRQPALSESHLRLMAPERRIEIFAPSFSSVPPLIVGTTRLAVMHRRLAMAAARILPLAIAPMPFAVPDVIEMLQHHQARTGDAGLAWLRARILAIAHREWSESNPLD
jgi:DNA-binding transcriptional LysR family regulator